MSWFGTLGLAWKYALVFGCLLVITIGAGLIKVAFDRRKLRNIAAKNAMDVEAQSDRIRLAERQRDEGDLFGIRALEAGYTGGVAQSRPTTPLATPTVSRRPSISTNDSSTLIGTPASSTPKLVSPMISVTEPSSKTTTLSSFIDPPTHPSSPPKKNIPPRLRLEPSEAEITGRNNHGAVDMRRAVPPSPVHPKSSASSTSPTPWEIDSEDNISPTTPAFGSNGPQSPGLLRPDTYVPCSPPQLPVVECVTRISWRPEYAEGEGANAKSMAASLDYTLGARSKTPSPLPSPVKPTDSYIPRRSRDTARSIFPTEPIHKPRKDSKTLDIIRSKTETYGDGSEDEFYILKPKVYQPSRSHNIKRNESVNSINNRRRSSVSLTRHKLESGAYTRNESISRSTSTASRRHSFGSVLEVPSSGRDTRLSDFYDAYYRNSQDSIAPSEAVQKTEKLSVPRHSTIVEVPSPLTSPWPRANRMSVQSPGIGVAR